MLFITFRRNPRTSNISNQTTFAAIIQPSPIAIAPIILRNNNLSVKKPTHLVLKHVDLALELAAFALRRLQLSQQLLVLVAAPARRVARPIAGHANLCLEAGAQHLAVGHLVLKPSVLIAEHLVGVAQLVQALLKVLVALYQHATVALRVR